MIGVHNRNVLPMLSSTRCGAADPLRWILQITRGWWKDALAHSRWCAGVRRAT